MAGLKTIERYVESEVLAKLEKAMTSPRPHAAKLIDLASLYYDLGRDEDALALYRRGLQIHRRELALYEQTAALLRARCDTAADESTLTELEQVITSGLGLGASDILTALGDELPALRAGLELRRAGAAESADPVLSPTSTVSASPAPLTPTPAVAFAPGTRATR